MPFVVSQRPEMSPAVAWARSTVLVLSSLLLLPALVPAQAPAAQPLEAQALAALLPSDPLVRTGTTRSGVRYYVRQNSRPEGRAELRLVVASGSLHEDDRQLGLAHFVEHMAFNGTDHFEKNEAIEYLRSIGMEFGAGVNAFTSFDRTVYQLRLPTDDSAALKKGLLILEDWAAGLSFEPAEIERERGVVIEEWRGGRGAAARVRDQHLPVLLAGSRRAERQPIGDPDLLQSFAHQDLLRYYRTWYRPERMAVIAVGDFDAAEMERRIERAFRKLGNRKSRSRRAPAQPEVVDEVQLAPGDRISVVTDPEIQRSRIELILRHRSERSGTVGEFRDDLIDSLFLQMFNERLGELLQLAEPPFLGAGAGLQRVDDTTLLYSLALSPSEGRELAGLEALAVEAERVRQHGFLEAELDRQRVDFVRAFERAYEERETTDSRSFVDGYVDNFLDGDPYPDVGQRLELVRQLLPGIEIAEINTRARSWSTGEDRVILVTAPEEGAEALPETDQILQLVQDVRGREVEPWVDEVSSTPLIEELPQPGEITNRSTLADLGVTHWTLSNGIEVYLKPTDFKKDEVFLRAFSPGGTSLVSDEDYPSAEMAETILGLSGLADHSLIELGKMLTGKVVSVSPTLEEESEGFRGGGSPEDLETLFQLLYLQATAPRYDTQAFASFTTRMTGLLRNRRSRPEVVFGETIEEALYQNHPRRQPLDEEFVSRVDHQRALQVYRERFADFSDFTFVIVGSFEISKLEPLVERYLASLPAAGREEAPRDLGIRVAEGTVEREVAMGMEEKAQVQLVLSGPFVQSVEERLRLQVMVEVLRNRLRDRVREQLGGTYGVSVSASTSHWPQPSYRLGVSFGSDPQRIDELIAVVFDEMDRMTRELVASEELEKVRETERRNRETALQQNGFWLGSLSYALEKGEDLAQILTFEDRLTVVDLEAVRGAAQAYLGRENLGKFILRPAAAVEPGGEQ
jgi:zinc protease